MTKRKTRKRVDAKTFWRDVTEAEQRMGEQAAIVYACEKHGLSYETLEYLELEPTP